eukprot:1157525-Pelagomonas_calceolata.AAC.6
MRLCSGCTEADYGCAHDLQKNFCWTGSGCTEAGYGCAYDLQRNLCWAGSGCTKAGYGGAHDLRMQQLSLPIWPVAMWDDARPVACSG